jgi:hypothetical protein
MYSKIVLLITSSIIFSACGGGGSTSTPFEKNSSTAFTPPKTIEKEKNSSKTPLSIKDTKKDLNISQLTEKTPKDTIPPTITLLGDNPLKVQWKSKFIDPGVELSDNVDNKEDIKLEIITDLNTSVFTLRDFNITYIATDSAGNQAKAIRVIKLYRTKEQIENLTQKYKVEWYDRAVEKYNSNDPEYPWTHPYISYKFPDDADFEPGNPPDKPLTSKEWLEIAGVGFTKKISIPSGPYSYDEKLVKEWKAKGLRAGRFHISFHAFLDKNDSNKLRLDKNKLKVLKDACELFTNEGIPVVISTGADMTPEALVNDREGTFYKELDWWRQFAEYFKDVSYLLAFENFIECHAFDSSLKADWALRLHIDNNETRFPDFTWKGKTLIDNYVSGIGYNNLNAEIAKVVRVTNPKRVIIYKPGGTGRTGMPYITPWRWGSEPDYLNTDKFYWAISAGGGANMRTSYVYGIREENATLRAQKISTAKSYSWGPILDYYQHTQLPIWISLFGIKTEDNTITTQEVVSYINWYLDSIQTKAYNKKTMKRTRVPAGFQQSWWLWHFGIKNPYWKETTYNDWNVSQIVNALGSHSFGGDIKPKYYPPAFLNKKTFVKKGAFVGGEFNATLFYEAISDKEDNITFKKLDGPDWLEVLSSGEIKGTPTIDDVGENNFTVAVVGSKGDMDTKKVQIIVDRYEHIDSIATDDAMCKRYEADKNFANEKEESLRTLANKYAKVAFFKFHIDTQKTIKKAHFVIPISSNANTTLELSLVENNWNQDEITWNNQPKIVQTLKEFSIDKTTRYSDVDISEIVQENGDYSFRVETKDYDAHIYFKESSKKPKIVLEVE